MVKVISGVRRCGKSSLMLLWRDELIRRGYAQENIVYINKELLEFDVIQNHRQLAEFIAQKLPSTGKRTKPKRAVFIDEVQQITGWEKTVASLLAEGAADLYVTGSNSYLLSSELTTLLTGRFVELHVYPLSFREFLTFRGIGEKTGNLEIAFQDYLQWGGMPGLHPLWGDTTAIHQYLTSVFHSILFKDVLTRHHIRDAAQFEALARFVMANAGNITSAKKIADYFKCQRLRVSVDTAINYLGYLRSAFLIYKTHRFDIRGKRHLEIQEKYFSVDQGLRNTLVRYRQEDLPGLFENLVCLELLRRGYRVSVGADQRREIDFVAQKRDEILYVQVAYRIEDKKTADREFGNLLAIRDNYPKIVVSGERNYPDRDGVRHRNIIDFLLEK